MSPKKSEKNLPFVHRNFDTTVNLLNLARNLSQKSKEKDADVSNILASTMLFVSVVEYMAQYLLNSLRELVKNNTYLGFNGIMYIDETKKNEKFTLGQYVSELRKYSFPDSQEIIRLFEEISRLRNIVFHNLSKMDEKELVKIDECMGTIPDLAEELITKVDTVSEGFRKMIYPQQEQKGQNGTT
jgi:hypothetical protein